MEFVLSVFDEFIFWQLLQVLALHLPERFACPLPTITPSNSDSKTDAVWKIS